MKKFVSILLLAALAATLLAVSAFATASTTVTIGNGAEGIKVPEGTTTATVAVTLSGNPGISSGQLMFDCSGLDFTIKNIKFVSPQLANGGINTANSIEGDGQLVKLEIDLSNAEVDKAYDITFTNKYYFFGEDSKKITDIEFVPTTITVASKTDCKHQNTKTINDKAATCTEDGYTGDTYCNDCEKTIESGETIKATGHQNTKIINKKDATCTEDGYTGDTYCNDCEKTIKSGETINAGHSWGSWVNCDENPDCNHQGRHERTCSVCPETEDEEHKWGEDGKCTKCGAKEENKPEETTPGGTTGGGNDDSNKPSDDGKKDDNTGKKDDGKKAPKTGDESNLVLWASVLLVACGAAVVVVTKKKHN